ncbi:MAG: hypothetical protein JWQ96_1048 [Segetibacter sp.]|nr:hypothetical protein [Segetibacter sp.]
MARQSGIIPIAGTIGNFTFYKTTDGFLVKEKTVIDPDKLANSPNYQRTRENNQEFGRAGKATKLLRTAFNNSIKKASDNRMTSRLTSDMLKVIKLDSTNARGQRNVIDGELELLQGFECNKKVSLGKSFFAPYTTEIDRAAGALAINIPPFIPANMVVVPAGTSHFRLFSQAAAINFETEVFETSQSESIYLPYNSSLTALISLSHTLTPANSNPLLLSLGIEYMQEVNGTQYPLKNGTFNAMALVKIQGL